MKLTDIFYSLHTCIDINIPTITLPSRFTNAQVINRADAFERFRVKDSNGVKREMFVPVVSERSSNVNAVHSHCRSAAVPLGDPV